MLFVRGFWNLFLLDLLLAGLPAVAFAVLLTEGLCDTRHMHSQAQSDRTEQQRVSSSRI